jgi:hypothetical protein
MFCYNCVVHASENSERHMDCKHNTIWEGQVPPTAMVCLAPLCRLSVQILVPLSGVEVRRDRHRRMRPGSAWRAGLAVLLIKNSVTAVSLVPWQRVTLAARSAAASARPLRTSHGATSPEAGSSAVSSSSLEFADVTFEDGAFLFPLSFLDPDGSRRMGDCRRGACTACCGWEGWREESGGRWG